MVYLKFKLHWASYILSGSPIVFALAYFANLVV